MAFSPALDLLPCEQDDLGMQSLADAILAAAVLVRNALDAVELPVGSDRAILAESAIEILLREI